MTWGHPARGKIVLFAGDIALVLLAMFLGSLLRLGEFVNLFRVYTGATLIFTFTCLSLLYVFDLYNPANLADSQMTLTRLCLVGAVGAVVCSSSFYFLPPYRYGRGILVLAVLLLTLLAYAWRRFYLAHHALFLSPLPTLVLGTGSSAEAVRLLLERNDLPYELVGFVRTVGEPREPVVPAAQVLGDTSRLRVVVEGARVRCLVVAGDTLSPDVASTLTRLKFEGASIYPVTDFSMRIAEELPVEFLSDSWLWFARGFDLLQVRLARRIKRLSDLLLATIGLLLTLPLSLITLLAIKLDSPGPVLLRQQRVGWLERPFALLKFRSMQVGAEAPGSAQWASVNDPRVTRVGCVMRKLHIDEIPQMVNVLKGEMSFIGPRPERPEFVEQLKTTVPFYHLRHYVPPGITGWAQVKYPYGASVEDAQRKLQFDLYYILNASPLFDLRILLKTVQVLLFQRGSR